jgi:hypothetical protein
MKQTLRNYIENLGLNSLDADMIKQRMGPELDKLIEFEPNDLSIRIHKILNHSTSNSLENDISLVVEYLNVFLLKGTITDISIHTKIQFDQAKLNFLIDKGDATAEEIADVISKIVKLYKLKGGTGITFLESDIEIFELQNS